MGKVNVSEGYDVYLNAIKAYKNTEKTDRSFVRVVAYDMLFGEEPHVTITVAEEIHSYDRRQATVSNTALTPPKARELAQHLIAAAEVAETAKP